MQKSKTAKTAKTEATPVKTAKTTRKKPGPKSKDKLVRELQQLEKADKQLQNAIDAEISRNHNFTKMIVTGFNAQIERIIETDTLLELIERNDLLVLRAVITQMLKRWEIEKEKKSDGMEQTERNDLYG